MNKHKGFSKIYIIIIILTLIGLVWFYIIPTYNEMSSQRKRAESYREYVANNPPIEGVEKKDGKSESFNRQPARILSINNIGDQKWELKVDILTYNPEWSPANLGVPKYLNQNTKIRTLLLDQNTIIYSCEDSKGNIVSGERMNLQKLLERISNVLNSIDEVVVQDIDVVGSKITATYEQCAS